MAEAGEFEAAIERPVDMKRNTEITKITKRTISKHWAAFSLWFDGFRDHGERFDTWLGSRITNKVKTLDRLFKQDEPVSALFVEFRGLLDYFQFMLDVVARGQSDSMSAQKSERELEYMEGMIDLLVTFIFRNHTGEPPVFTEFE